MIILRLQKYDYFLQKKEKGIFCGEILFKNGKRLPQEAAFRDF